MAEVAIVAEVIVMVEVTLVVVVVVVSVPCTTCQSGSIHILIIM